MIHRFIIYLALIFFIIAAGLSGLLHFGFLNVGVPVAVSEPPPRGVILLVPLDGRPPCTDYVTSLARMAGFRVILPPAELLDDYRRPANVAGVRDWLQQNIGSADAAILSIDMLLHGGLLASRKGSFSEPALNEVVSLLTTIHEEHPWVKLFAFNIIPRLLISDDPETEKYKQLMVEWSMLQETVMLFENPNDLRRLHELESSIPSDIPARYRKLYSNNHQVSRQLVSLRLKGILAGIVLGQDDSAPFGLGNMERKRMEIEIGNLTSNIFMTRGTDEVALSLLVPATLPATGNRYKVYVHYTEARTSEAILPYMPNPLSRIVEEKLMISAATVTDSVAAADYILVIHAGNSQSLEKNIATEANRIRSWLENGHNVAVVDLATDWIESQTLLPHLIRNETPVHQLLGYTGWNTASNSIGTAVTQASMSLSGRNTREFDVALYRDLARIGFLNERILDDWFYQKNFRHQLNDELQKMQIDPYDLRLSRKAVSNRIRHQLYNAHLKYIRANWRDAIFPLTPNHLGSYAVDTWILRAGLPWDRTFEIFIGAKPEPARIIHR